MGKTNPDLLSGTLDLLILKERAQLMIEALQEVLD
jgi:hypothetical protein